MAYGASDQGPGVSRPGDQPLAWHWPLAPGRDGGPRRPMGAHEIAWLLDDATPGEVLRVLFTELIARRVVTLEGGDRVLPGPGVMPAPAPPAMTLALATVLAAQPRHRSWTEALVGSANRLIPVATDVIQAAGRPNFLTDYQQVWLRTFVALPLERVGLAASATRRSLRGPVTRWWPSSPARGELDRVERARDGTDLGALGRAIDTDPRSAFDMMAALGPLLVIVPELHVLARRLATRIAHDTGLLPVAEGIHLHLLQVVDLPPDVGCSGWGGADVGFGWGDGG